MPKRAEHPTTKSPSVAQSPVGLARPCPVCGAATVAPHHPFCSARCQDVDLGRWLKGSYAIPGRPEGFGEEDE